MARHIKTFGGKHQTHPIKDPKDLERFMFYLLKKKEKAKTSVKKYQADRNWMLCLLGFNTAFRADDLLQLRVIDLINGYVHIKENKTGKNQNFRMNKQLHNDIKAYVERYNLSKYDYMFMGQKTKQDGKSYINPITRQQAWKVVSSAAKAVGLPQTIGVHSLRKTFGYQYYARTKNLIALSGMLNHDDPNVTLLYIMWDIHDTEKERSEVYLGGVHK